MSIFNRKKDDESDASPEVDATKNLYTVKDKLGWVKWICVVATIVPTIGMTWILLMAPIPDALFAQTVYITVWALVEFVLIMGFLVRTPALKYLVASFTKRMILIHPRENRYLEHVMARMYGGLARIKKRGYYKVRPKDVYVEGSSKVPSAVVYGNFGLTLDIKAADAVQKLKLMGIDNADTLVETLKKLKETNQGLSINLLGESVDAAELAEYFNRSERSDLTESEIQRRQAATIMSKLKQPGDMMKWAIAAFVLLFGIAIAYNIVVMAMPPQQVVQQAAAPATNYITQAAGALSQTPTVGSTPTVSVT